MPADKKLYEMLNEAEEKDLIGLSRCLCEKILESDSNNAKILVNYARQEISLGQYEAAAKALDRAEHCAPPDKLKYVLSQKGHLNENKGHFDEAEALFIKAHELDPTEATFLIFAASAAFRAGRLKRAEELSRKATLCEKGSIDEAYFNLGGYLLSQRRYAEAKKCYEMVFELDPDYVHLKERLEDIDSIMSMGPN